MRPVGSGDSKFPSGFQNHFGFKPDPTPNKDVQNPEALFPTDIQAGKMMIPIARRANQKPKVEVRGPDSHISSSGLPAFFKNVSKDTFKPHVQADDQRMQQKDELLSQIKLKPEVRVQLDEAPVIQIANLPVTQVDPVWSQESEGIERIPGENPDGKSTISFSSQTGELIFWSTKGFGKVQLPDMITRKAVCSRFYPLSKLTASQSNAGQKADKPAEDDSEQDDDSSSDEKTNKKKQAKSSVAATKGSQRDLKGENKIEESSKLSSSGVLGLGKRGLRNNSPGNAVISAAIKADAGLSAAPADLNLFKQIVKLKSTMKVQDHLDLPTKFAKLKSLLNKDFSLSGAELSEVFRVENARAGATKIRDFKHAENLYWRLGLVLTNTGAVWLVDMADRLSSTAVFGENTAESLTFRVQGEGLIHLPDLSAKETAVAADLVCGPAKTPLVLVATSTGRLLVFSVGEETRAVVEASSSSRKPQVLSVKLVGQNRSVTPVTHFAQIDHNRWLCVFDQNKLAVLNVQRESKELVRMEFSQPGCFTLPEEIHCISGLKIDTKLSLCFFWQFGALFMIDLKKLTDPVKELDVGSLAIKCILDEPKEIKEVLSVHERPEIDQSKYQRLYKGLNEEKIASSYQPKQFSAWICFADSTVVVIDFKNQENKARNYTVRKLVRLHGVHLCGAAFSPSLCALVTLTQPALFEDGSEFRIFGIDLKGDLEGPHESLTADNIGSRANSISGINVSHTDVVDMLGTIMKIFDQSPGNFSDIYACLLAANKVELLLNFLEKILIGNTSKLDGLSRQTRPSSVTAEQQLALLEQVTKSLSLDSAIFTKHILSKILLNLLNFGQDLKRISPILRASIALRELKMAGASPELLKILSGNNLSQSQSISVDTAEHTNTNPQQQVIYECPKCQTKALSMTVGNFSSECGNCGEMLNLFLDHAGSNLRYLNEDAEVVCQFCGIVHPEPEQKESSYSQSNWNPDPSNPARSVCLVCSQRLTTFRLLC